MLVQSNISIEEFQKKFKNEVEKKENFLSIYPHCDIVKENVYIHVEDGIYAIPMKEEKVFIKEMKKIEERDVKAYQDIVTEYEKHVEIAKYILEEMKMKHTIQAADIDIATFEEGLFTLQNDKGEVELEEIVFFPDDVRSDIFPGMMMENYWFKAAFLRLSDGWVQVEEAVRYSFGTYYTCEYTVITKEHAKEIEKELQKAIEEEEIEQKEVRFLRMMIQDILQ